jgi:hypothetical protein
MEIFTEPTRYEVSCLPLGHSGRFHFTITVSWRSPGQWAVLNPINYCLGTDGEWDYEPMNSSREDEWKATHRFSLEDALALAEEHAPKMRVRHITVQDALDGEYH